MSKYEFYASKHTVILGQYIFFRVRPRKKMMYWFYVHYNMKNINI